MQTLASFTPTATLRGFERGLLRVDVVLVMLILSLLGFALAANWLHLGRSIKARMAGTAVLLILATLAIVNVLMLVTVSFDVSENRRNSFSRIGRARSVVDRCAAHDHRLSLLRRSADDGFREQRAGEVAPIDAATCASIYPLAGRSGLFENDARYGKIEYRLGAKTAMSRSTTEEIVLDTIYGLAGVRAPAREASTYPGYPLAKRPAGAAVVFYVLWPSDRWSLSS